MFDISVEITLWKRLKYYILNIYNYSYNFTKYNIKL